MGRSDAPAGPRPQEGGSGQGLLPALSLPKGGGAIRGMGEKFSTNAATGTGALSVPIATSPGRAGFELNLELSYDSGAGNGPFGIGWRLSTPSITRKTDKGIPRYLDAQESDTFVLSGAEDLVPVPALDADNVEVRELDEGQYLVRRYRPRVEGLFARIERWTNKSDGDVHWRATTRDNVLNVYGRSQHARIADPSAPLSGRDARFARRAVARSRLGSRPSVAHMGKGARPAKRPSKPRVCPAPRRKPCSWGRKRLSPLAKLICETRALRI